MLTRELVTRLRVRVGRNVVFFGPHNRFDVRFPLGDFTVVVELGDIVSKVNACFLASAKQRLQTGSHLFENAEVLITKSWIAITSWLLESIRVSRSSLRLCGVSWRAFFFCLTCWSRLSASSSSKISVVCVRCVVFLERNKNCVQGDDCEDFLNCAGWAIWRLDLEKHN